MIAVKPSTRSDAARVFELFEVTFSAVDAAVLQEPKKSAKRISVSVSV